MMDFEEWAKKEGIALHRPPDRGLGTDYSHADTRRLRDAWEAGQREQKEKDAEIVENIVGHECRLKSECKIIAKVIRES